MSLLSSAQHLTPAHTTLRPGGSRATPMRSIVSFAERRPAVYLAGCCLLGFTIRLGMAHGDWGLFFDPLYPLIHR